MKKTLIPMLVLIAACGGGSTTAATVDGKSITVGDVETIVSSSQGAVEPGAFRDALRILVVDAIASAAARDSFQIEPTDEQIQAKRDEIKTSVGATTEDEFLQIAADAGFSADGVLTISRQQVIVDLVTARLLEDAGPATDADLQALYDENLYQYVSEACVKHILVATPEEAEAVKLRLADGEDFGAVAAEVSIDPSAATNQGDLGCGPLAGYVPEFGNAAATATIGEVTGPVESQFGQHLILVESRTDAAPLAEIRDQLQAQLDSTRGQTLFQDWLVDVVTAAQVEVDPQYGTWTTDPQPQILPPATSGDTTATTQP